MNNHTLPFWSFQTSEMLQKLEATSKGLTSKQAQQRLSFYGANLLKPSKRSDSLTILLGQFKSPIILILIFAAGLSFFLHDSADALIIFIIVLISGVLGFWQEKGAANAFEKLVATVQIKSTVLRDGKETEVSIDLIVPGDVLSLNAGDIIPADCLILDSKDLFANEAPLTGETFPVEKEVKVLGVDTSLGQRVNSLWMGTNVVSGSAYALVVHTGKETEFGKVSERLKLKPDETEFEKGVLRFGYFLMEVTLLMVIAIFAINVYLARPILDSFLFSLALAVGLTPQLLPAIISINLSHGAKRMAQRKVIVKKLSSIENLGSMNLLCCDKTGTLTSGELKIHSYCDMVGCQSDTVLLYAYINAYYQTGFNNPIDQAIIDEHQFDLTGYQKLDEVPYDFIRKRLSVSFSKDNVHLMVTKGALENILEACSSAEVADGKIVDISTVNDAIQQKFEDFSNKGLRTLGLAYRYLGAESSINKDSETKMTFLGFIFLFDPPKPNIVETIKDMEQLGIELKVITGDNKLVAGTVGQEIGLLSSKIITGNEIQQMSDEALLKHVNNANIFAEVEPNQKERIILALRKNRNVVGYVGDGINDASALHAADVGISVDSAVDVAKEAANIVLLEKDLGVLVEGVKEGRVTFANTLKYVFMATSANFGNMFSMAGISIFLPFLPLLPKQILLINLLTDLPEMTIATDSVDIEMVKFPRRWDVAFIRKFMLTFGFVSSVFDYLTFGVLLWLLPGMTDQFRTGWFLESVISASLIVLVIRSRKPFFKSKIGKYLSFATFLTILAALLFPITHLAGIFGFEPLSFSTIFILGIIVFLYIVTAEVIKRFFYSRVK